MIMLYITSTWYNQIGYHPQVNIKSEDKAKPIDTIKLHVVAYVFSISVYKQKSFQISNKDFEKWDF